VTGEPDPDAGTDGPDPSWDVPGQLGEPGIPDTVPGVAPAKPKRGRPRCTEEPCGSLSVWLPVTAQDRICALAKQRRQSVSEYLRDVLIALFLRRP